MAWVRSYWLWENWCHFAYTPVSPTPISPTYCHSVPFCLLMHNVKKSVLLGKQYSSSLCASQIYGWVCGYLLWGDLVAAELWSLDLEHLFIWCQQPQEQQPPPGLAQQVEANHKESSTHCVKELVEIFKQEQSDTGWGEHCSAGHRVTATKEVSYKDKKIGELKSRLSQEQITLKEYVRGISAYLNFHILQFPLLCKLVATACFNCFTLSHILHVWVGEMALTCTYHSSFHHLHQSMSPPHHIVQR